MRQMLRNLVLLAGLFIFVAGCGTALTHLPAGTGLQSVTISEGTMTIVIIRA